MPDRQAHPLYDRRFEHDACGVGFVADAGGRSRRRVLPLALAGLGSLGHRGAFAADGASSDGAGVLLPLEQSVLGLIAPNVPGRPGVVSVFLPRERRGRATARRIVAAALAEERLPAPRWRPVPVDPAALGSEAATTRPEIAQAVVERPTGLSDARFELRLILARRRMETAARLAGPSLTGFAVPSASCRSVVYKGLVAGERLAELYPDLATDLPLSHAIFHQRYATNTHPEWRLAQPFRSIAHNGEINTIRTNREQVHGRAADPLGAPGSAARRLVEAGPLLSPAGSDSLSLDEALELLVATGWSLEAALLALIPEAMALRPAGHPLAGAFARRTAGFLAPWDGPAALVFGDGRRVGALVDRNGLRPLAFAVTRDRLVAAASEAGAVPIEPSETIRRGRLGPGEILLVDPRRGAILEDLEAKTEILRRSWRPDAPRTAFADAPPGRRSHAVGSGDERPAGGEDRPATTPAVRHLAGLDAERARLDIRTMVGEAKEPLWSMGDDTPTPALARIDRPVTDHLRQAFAQVTNPPIDPERERAVMDLHVELGRRPALLGGIPTGPRTVRLDRPVIADLDSLLGRIGLRRVRRLDATWDPDEGPPGLARAVDRLATEALLAVDEGSVEVLAISDRAASLERLPLPGVLAVGAVHTALGLAGLRGRADLLVDTTDVLDVHGLAMTIAAGASVVHPRLALELAGELAGSRGFESLEEGEAAARLLDAFEAGLRKTLARMGISAVASYVGGALFETLELAPEVVECCFPSAAAWPGRVGFATLAERALRRREGARTIEAAGDGTRMADPGLARYRADGELHLYAPPIVKALQAVADGSSTDLAGAAARSDPAVVRDGLRIRRPRGVRPVPLDEVEPARAIARRFVASAMSVGALSPEAHQAVTIGMQRAGGAANTGEGGEDPAWYRPGADGERRDARIKQVASARFGVTATYLARADQLEIKIAQGSKPGEGGQLPGKKATAEIAALRRAQPGQALISPPPHHDIYSIEDLAQLIADLRAINPAARVGVKLVASRGVGTIAAGVVKAGADYVHLAGHAGGTGASPLSSIKHAGAPWELGLAEVHQTLLRNGLRDRVVLRTDGGLQVGRDLLVAALLGAEEFGFGTAALVALGCDMARQCHLDTCPTGIATQRPDLRAKFSGTPEQVERYALAVAEDLRRELAAIGARAVGEVVGEARRYLAAVSDDGPTDLAAIVGFAPWPADPARRADRLRAVDAVRRAPASPVEHALVMALRNGDPVPVERLAIGTADRSFGAELSGALERGAIRRPAHGPIRLVLRGAAGQSLGAFLVEGVELTLVGQANDYVAKGLSGGTVVVRPEPEVVADPSASTAAGNVCLFGATAGRLHVVGRAGMRFAVRNSGAEAVVEGLGAHGCEYMTGGTVVVLGPIGPNFGAGMTGGRAYLLDPAGRSAPALSGASVGATRLSAVLRDRGDGAERVAELTRLVAAHAAAGSELAERLAVGGGPRPDDVWLVEPLATAAGTVTAAEEPGAPVPVPLRIATGGEAPATARPAGTAAVPTLS
jgi:glutamate synthase domain-containing protein 2/glutamate synthase domain-containing protein 1/glutamate synthase domain-containing protein 3